MCCLFHSASFHLSEKFDDVVGIDFSHAFVQAANSMKEKKEMPYKCRVEGDIFEDRVAKVNENAYPERYAHCNSLYLNTLMLGACNW